MNLRAWLIAQLVERSAILSTEAATTLCGELEGRNAEVLDSNGLLEHFQRLLAVIQLMQDRNLLTMQIDPAAVAADEHALKRRIPEIPPAAITPKQPAIDRRPLGVVQYMSYDAHRHLTSHYAQFDGGVAYGLKYAAQFFQDHLANLRDLTVELYGPNGTSVYRVSVYASFDLKPIGYGEHLTLLHWFYNTHYDQRRRRDDLQAAIGDQPPTGSPTEALHARAYKIRVIYADNLPGLVLYSETMGLVALEDSLTPPTA